MKTKYIITAFIATAIAQLFVPFKMVFENEMAYLGGTEYKFKTAPVDPNDPFRGKYVQLDFAADTIRAKQGTYTEGEQLYALIENGNDGFARIKKLQRTEPGNTDFIIVQAGWNYDDVQHVDFPFNRYYMEESKAPEAESAYISYNRNIDSIPAYAIVAVKRKTAVIKDVMLDNMPIKDYVEKHRNDEYKK